MTTAGPSLCESCIRLEPGWKCAAFPDGIPADIIWNYADHRVHIRGDHGIVYEQDGTKRGMFELWEGWRDLVKGVP